MKGFLIKYRWLLVLLFAFFITIFSTTIPYSYEAPATVINAKTNTEYAIESSKLKSTARTRKQITVASAETRLLIVHDGDFDYSNLEGLKSVVLNKNLGIMEFDTADNALTAYKILKTLPQIKSVEFDQVIQVDNVFTADIGPDFSIASKYHSWGALDIGADDYTDYIKKSYHTPVVVAVVDTGVYAQHPFLQSRIESNGYDFVPADGDDNPDDENGHGTHVAGIIVDCTQGYNQITIMPVRVLDENGSGWMSDIANGVLYAVDNGAEVVNLSLRGGHSEYLDSVIDEVIDDHAIVVCAAGNEHVDIDANQVCPAHISDAITVGAVNGDWIIEDYSNYGKKIDVVAPGSRIKSCALDGGYVYNSGTSMAAPHISACAALLRVRYPKKNCMEVSSILKRAAYPDSPKKYYGSGIVDMENLLDPISYQDISVKSKVTYTGNAIKPSVKVSRNGEKLFGGEDYTVSYKNNTKIGTASIVIKGKGSYTGSKTLHFKIVPKGTEIKSVKAKKKGFTVKWKKQESKTSGYQIQYSTSKSFKNAKKKTIKGKDNTSYKLTKLKSKKTYYIRVRTYKTVDGTKYYSFWSDVKSIKTK